MELSLNENWLLKRIGGEPLEMMVNVPYDCMLLDKVSLESKGGPNICWLDCADYSLERDIEIPKELEGKDLIIEFEGVYHNAEVYLNDELIATRPYGFTNFYVDITDKVHYGGVDHIKVIAHNADQPNSRFYTGSGIYRPVHLYVLNKKRVNLNGIKVLPLDYEKKLVRLKVSSTCKGELGIRFLDEGGKVLAEDKQPTEGEFEKEYSLPEAKLWSPASPNLITVEISFENETYLDYFGLRTISVSAEKGFQINGEKILLQGACLHADNGIIGAASYRAAEFRKVRLMKEAGYNAIRSAHNPMSKSMLEACDRLGILVMEEYVDMWIMHKLKYDYASYCRDYYEQDLIDMCDKDYNRPSVVLFSTGNEVGESSKPEGIEFGGKLSDVVRKHGANWPVTCGINVFFNALCAMGMGVYSDSKAEKKQAVGSEFFNNLAGLTGDSFMKWGATWPIVDRKTKGIFEHLDVAGYNYGIGRYRHDAKKYKNRVILGSETFCSDAVEFMRLADEIPSLIGDFVWAGLDYLGEIAIGSWEYAEYADTFQKAPGWMSAGSGRVDLVGNFLGEVYYTKMAFRQIPIAMAVVPVSHTGEKHSPSAWKFSNALPTWSWNGLEGKPAEVEVYSTYPKVGLFINGKQVAIKKSKKDGKTTFRLPYEQGELKAVAYAKDGTEAASYCLRSGGEENHLEAFAEPVDPRFNDLRYIKLAYTDGQGNVKPLLRGRVDVEVEGGILIALGHGCPFNKDGYKNSWTNTYYGQALAVVEYHGKPIKLKAKSEFGDAEIVIE